MFHPGSSRPTAEVFPAPIVGRPRRPFRGAPLAVVLFLLVAALTTGRAQETITQTFTLRAGWNAIWLEVEPTNNAIGAVFAGVPVEAVWAYFEKGSPAEFIKDVNELPWNNPTWRRFFPPPSPKAVINTLFTLNVHRAYLVKATNACTLAITGQPSVRPVAWTPDSLNFRGFPVDSESPPTWDDFFAPAQAHAGQPVYQLNADGLWELVAGYRFNENGFPEPVPGTNVIRFGEAYWVYCAGGSTYTAPLSLEVDGGNGLAFSDSLDALTIRMGNLTTSEIMAFVNPLTDGEVLPLSYYVLNVATDSHWVPFPEEYRTSLGPGETFNQRVSIRRTAFSAAHYGTVLSVSDGAGTRYLLPVSADQRLSPGGGTKKSGDPGDPNRGLWVGNVTLNAVSEANAFTAQATTSGGNDTNLARAIFEFPGPDNDFEIIARAPGQAANGLAVYLSSRGADPADGAAARYDFVNRRLSIAFNRGLTRSATLLAALNNLTEEGFNTTYEARPANAEGDTGFIAETTRTSDAGGRGSEFNLRLLLHVESGGATRLLKQVIQMWEDGTYTNDASGYRMVDQPGRYVLLTDDARILNFQGAALRDGEPVGRRISSAAFDFPDEDSRHPGTRRMAGAFGLGRALTNRFSLASDAPTNPFRHRYHPDHQAGLRIVRTIQLHFHADPPPGVSADDYGDNTVAGSYREVLEGLHKRHLVVTGTFTLNRVSTIGELNP